MSARPIVNLTAGADRTIRIGIRNADGAARDLTDETIEFRAAPRLDADTAAIYKQDGDGVEVVDAALGLIDIVFTRAETAVLGGVALNFDIRLTDRDGLVTKLDFGEASDPKTWGLVVIERSLLATG